MISLIVIIITLFLVYLMPISVALIGARCISRTIVKQKDRFAGRYSDYSHNYSYPRRLMPSDILSAKSLSLWLVPILVLGMLIVPLELATRGQFWGTSEAGNFDPGVLGYIAIEATLFSSTIALAIWWLDLSNKGIRHAGTYAVCAWILARAVWFLPHPFAIRELTRVHLNHVLGGEFGVGVAAGVACISAVSVFVFAMNDWSASLRWVLLALAVPFVGMHWILEEISFALLFWDITYAGMVLGAVIWMRRSKLSLRHDQEYMGDQSGPGPRQILALTIAVLVIAAAILTRVVFISPNDTSTFSAIAVPWMLIFALSIMFYVLVGKLSKVGDATSWTAFVFLICMVAINLPGADARYPASVNDNLALWFPMDWHVAGVGVLGAAALLSSLLLDRWRDARAYMVGMCWPAVFQVMLSKHVELDQIPDLGANT